MEENKKSKLGLGILIGVLLALVIGLSAFIIYDKLLSNTDNKIENNDNNSIMEEKDEIESLSVDNYVANDLYESISFHVCSLYKDYYYEKDKTLATQLSDNLRIYFAARNTNEWTADDYGGRIIEESDLKQTYTRLFGKNVNYKYVDEQELAIIEKQSDGKIRYFEGDTCWSSIEKKVMKVEKNITKDEIYVYEKVAFLIFEGTEEHMTLFSDYKKTQKIATEIGKSREYIMNQYSSQLDTYKYTFKSNEDGNYYFYSVEKEKK